MTMVDPGRFPNIVGALREAGLDPMTQRVPVAPAAHYVMGGIVTDLHGHATRAPVRRRRVRLHRAARRQPARVQLAQRVLRVRPPRGARRPRRPAARGRSDHRRAEIEPPSRETRKAVWRLAGLERTAEGLDELEPPTRTRSPGSSPPRALAREETRGAHARAEFPEPDPALDGHHTVLDPDTETPRFEAWTAS